MPKPSEYQMYILKKLSTEDGRNLHNTYDGPGAPYRPKDGMYNGSFFEMHSHEITVSYRSIKSMLKAGLIKEVSRATGIGSFKGKIYETAQINYDVTEKAKQLIKEG